MLLRSPRGRPKNAPAAFIHPCTIIITNANTLADKVHDRMPVLLQPKGEATAPNCSSQQLMTICRIGRCRGASTAHARRGMIQLLCRLSGVKRTFVVRFETRVAEY